MAALALESGQPDVFFELPESSIRGIPLYTGTGEHLSLGFIEIGCRPNGKRGQLKDKRELFYQYWGAHYRWQYHIPWLPSVYRMISHYEPTNPSNLNVKKFSIDAALIYTTITAEMLADLTESEHQQIIAAVKEESTRQVLEDILEQNDAQYWNKVIFRARTNREIANVRGTMAEVLALKDIGNSVPNGMSLYRNEDIHYFSRRYRNGTEIDGVLTFYGEQPYQELIENVRKLSHLQVKDRWH